MSEFEDKLNKILSSPEDMEKIMGMARSLSGSLGSSDTDDGAHEGGGEEPSSIASALGSIDPKLLRMITRAFGQYSSGDSGKTAILRAIRPYLKEDKRHRMDQAAEIVKLTGLAKIAFSEFSGGEDGV